MANIVMNGNNTKKGNAKGKGKQTDIDSHYSNKPVDVPSAPVVAQAPPADISDVSTTTATPVPPPQPAQAAQTIREPADENGSDTTKWKRVAKRRHTSETENPIVAETAPVQVATAATEDEPKTPPPANVAHHDAHHDAPQDAPQKSATSYAAAREDGPPPVCRLNEATPKPATDSDSDKLEMSSMREAMREMEKAMKAMQQQMQTQAQTQHLVPPTPLLPMGYHVPVPVPIHAHMPIQMSQTYMQYLRSLPPNEYPGWMTPQPVQPGTYVPGEAASAAIAAAAGIPKATVVPLPPQPAQVAHVAHAKADKKQHAKPAQQAQVAHATKATASDEATADAEFSPFDLNLNDDCPAGFKCPNSKKPQACPKNHNLLGAVIKKGAKLPRFFCKWERPWKKGPNGKPLRCRNPDCYNSHLRGRDEFLKKTATQEASAEN